MSGKSILITGCSTGIGYDAAHALANRGWTVFATCRQQKDCDRLLAEGLNSFLLDYTQPASITSALNTALAHTGGTLDAVFNNGAFGIPGALEDLPREGLRAIFETNLLGYHDLTQQVIPVMRNQGGGRIVNCSSVLGLVGLRWRGAYVATKFALEGMTDTLRMELRGSNIHACLIEPGPITSKFRDNAERNFRHWIDWENSVHAEDYRRELDARFKNKGKKDPFELPPSAVTKKLIHALDAPRPKPRYFVTTPTYAMDILKRLLPTRTLDWLITRR